MKERRKGIAILGSTGSIGTQALDVIRSQAEYFSAEILTSFNNADLLIRQAMEFMPDAVVISNESKYAKVRDALSRLPIKVYAGSDAISQVVKHDNIDTVLTAMVGYSGLKPTLSAVEAGKNIALANKETLVVAGELVMNKAIERGVNIHPVDSEHSAIYQCMAGEWSNPIEKIYLTASGGPFRGKDRNFLSTVKKEQALKHPNWEMGAKITIDSASMMNKGLEMIEAKWLFNLKPEQIEVIVHPQSIIHSIVQFEDGSMKAQMGLPDMKLPIQYALAYPDRLKSDFPRFNFALYPQLSFEAPDLESFRNLALAMEAMKRGGNLPCILNAANEVAVSAFLHDRISFTEMSSLVEDCMQHISFLEHPTYDDYVSTDSETRSFAEKCIPA
ncbi:MAG: 1-deoxy-D-xylulose-5-phosphate reductoisomerase [Bacteroidetes bacterium]|nr:MAG: 1-deoxy-D-xylulose-5-phosphate reductoisomerase [Bacteroidota bacterium]REK00720.1 MAG: 1-deoxy-D-xylulose-5-phosphate reductoisomerase [Bacteroidota bacterium]REK35158.1 MAG: 1-deoxy-D-xylulose-5-phosphate reductoisomerase [Bacteroidota bacterium]REK48235.1 MAG: 1-deoxy-D-xylulose-5-phosphate reductoisomerase [Bacteroidota bacterium]